MTDNINIICPTNHFSNQNFDVNKKTLLLIKNNEYFEPIYQFEDKGSILNIQRLFNLNDPNILPDLKDAIISITKIIQKNCMSLPSLPDIYTFRQNIGLVERIVLDAGLVVRQKLMLLIAVIWLALLDLWM